MKRSNLLLLSLLPVGPAILFPGGISARQARPEPQKPAPVETAAEPASPNALESVGIGVGYFDVAGRDAEPALELVYTPDGAGARRMKPLLGLMVNSDGGLYGYAGISMTLGLPAGLTVSPSLSVGGYRQGSSLDLGSILQIRSGLQLDRPVRAGDGLVLFFYHLSNAGLGARNPGTEVLGLGWVVRW
ncbi:MAG: acyloxyacyl hydrolase [Gemmatimonadota bacterium]